MSKPDDDPYEEYFTNLNDEPPRIKAGGKSKKKKSAKKPPKKSAKKSTKKSPKNKRNMMSGGSSTPKSISPKKSKKKFFVKNVNGKEPFCVDRQGRRVPGKYVVQGIKGRPPFCATRPTRSNVKTPAALRKKIKASNPHASPAFIENAVEMKWPGKGDFPAKKRKKKAR